MIGEVISIGDELTSGQRLDTNSQWLSLRLGELGIRVVYHTTVADDLDANVRVFRQAFDRADVVIASGGLGPTADDLTRQAIADAVGVDLVQDDASLDHIRNLFAKRGRIMPAANTVQAMFPRGSRVVPNPHGTAPGIDFDIVRPGRRPARVFSLPGVPAEMKEMWEATVEPALRATGSGKVIRHRQIRCFGLGESELESRLPDLIRRGRQPSVGITVSQATITLRITAEGDSADACLAATEPTVQTIHECLGTLVFGAGDDELQHAIVRLLADRHQTVAVGEGGTGGLIATWLAEAEELLGASVFRGGTIDRGATADSVAAWATQLRTQFQADYGLVLGPFPTPDASGNPGHVAIALATASGVESQSALFAGHPEILKPRAAKQALNFLRLKLLG